MDTETKIRLERTLERMDHAADVFYAHAQTTDFHQFLEFTGFIREHTKMCRELLKRGVDFVAEPGELKTFEAHYIGEKFGCIFTPLLACSKGAFEAFLQGAEIDPEKMP